MSPDLTPGPAGHTAVLRLFESLAAATWSWLADARRLGLGFSEDTISDLAMLEIARSGLSGVDVKRVSKRDERTVGFDWLWVVWGPGPPDIYVVQAKKQKLDRSGTYSYGTLRYPAGAKHQIDALEDFADWLGAIPLYCFYNNVDDDTARAHWHCRGPRDLPQLGCTLAPLDVVRPIHDGRGRKGFRSIHASPRALPWRCLFHPGCTASGLANRAERLVEDTSSRGRAGVAELLSTRTSGGEQVVDRQDFVDRLDLKHLVDTYATGRFVPTPDRIVSLRLDERRAAPWTG